MINSEPEGWVPRTWLVWMFSTSEQFRVRSVRPEPHGMGKWKMNWPLLLVMRPKM